MRSARFRHSSSEITKKYSYSIGFDYRLYKHDIRASIAHARGLQKAGIITEENFQEIESVLKEIQSDIEEKINKHCFLDSVADEYEDIHMYIEAELTRRTQKTHVGEMLHTARSRNDQVATDIRLYLRDEIDKLVKEISRLQVFLFSNSQRHVFQADNSSYYRLIPGYTHLQRAQPIYVIHYFLAFVEMLERDKGRLLDTRKRMNRMPLGSAALAGSCLVLNREAMSRELEFDGPTHNSLDAVSDRDFAIELLATLSILGMHLSRLSEDFIIWNTKEFNFIEFTDRFCTGSSLMPQKKNPDMSELTRGKTGRIYGNLFNLLTVMKGLPMSYNRDMQEDKEALFDSLDTTHQALEIMIEMMHSFIFTNLTGQATTDPCLSATDIVDELVQNGIPFRQAYQWIGTLVRIAEEMKCSLDTIPLKTILSFYPHFPQKIIDYWKNFIREISKRLKDGISWCEVYHRLMAFLDITKTEHNTKEDSKCSRETIPIEKIMEYLSNMGKLSKNELYDYELILSSWKNLIDEFVNEGIAYSQAISWVGGLVRKTEEKARDMQLDTMPFKMDSFYPNFPNNFPEKIINRWKKWNLRSDDHDSIFNVYNALNKKMGIGSPSQQSIENEVNKWQKVLKDTIEEIKSEIAENPNWKQGYSQYMPYY